MTDDNRQNSKVRPKEFGPYLVTRKVAEGGMGSVYEAWRNPFTALGVQIQRGEYKELRKYAGIHSLEDALTEEESKKLNAWIFEQSKAFREDPDEVDRKYCQLLREAGNHRPDSSRRALKVLKNDLARDEKIVQRFTNEVAFLEQLNHPNIIKIKESGRINGTLYAAMEYVTAIDLEKTPLDISQKVGIVRKSLDALIHAHTNEERILHRDIKPSNLLVSTDLRTVKLSDFGISKALNDDSANMTLTHTGMIIGTPFYMDPERARGEPQDERSDVYSLGATLYCLLTGQPPAKGSKVNNSDDSKDRSRNLQQALAQIATSTDPQWVREYNQQVSEQLEDTVMLMIAKEKNDRLTTFEARSLLRFLDENEQLHYRESPSSVKRKKYERGLRKEIRKLKKNAAKDTTNRGAFNTLLMRYEDLANVFPKDTQKGINARIDCYNEAIDLVERLKPSSKAVNDKFALIKKRRALEYRRLTAHGFELIKKEPPKIGKKIMIGAAGTAIITMASLFGYNEAQSYFTRAGIDEAILSAEQAYNKQDYELAKSVVKQAQKDAEILPQSSDRFKKLKELQDNIEAAATYRKANDDYTLIRKNIREREYSKAAELIDATIALISGTNPPDASLRERMLTLQKDVMSQQEHIKKYETYIAVYKGLRDTYSQLNEEFTSLKTGIEKNDFCEHAKITDLSKRLASLLKRLENPDVVDPESIGYKEYFSGQRDILRLQNELPYLSQKLDEKQIDFISDVGKKYASFADIKDYTSPSLPENLKKARQDIGKAVAHQGNIRHYSLAYFEAQSDLNTANNAVSLLEKQVVEYNTLVEEAKKGKPEAASSLVKTYINFDHLDKAKQLLQGKEKQEGMQAYLAIIQAHDELAALKKTEKPEQLTSIAKKLADAYDSAGLKEKAASLRNTYVPEKQPENK